MIFAVHETDCDACAAVIVVSFGTVAGEFGITKENAPLYTAFSTTGESLKTQLTVEKRKMFAYRQNEDIVGFYALSREGEGLCELNNLCVLPQCRHLGIGTQLLQHAVKTAGELGYKTMLISIVEENKPLRAWYEGFGAVHMQTKKFPFFPFTCGYLQLQLNT